ncbi:MAG: glycosyltransferase family 4 protein [Armatimonadota bacterium]|nr:glycosyltransferase family 4 protein [Armatimonadota bacterium]
MDVDALRLVADGVVVVPLPRRSPYLWPLAAGRGRPYLIWRDESARMRARVAELYRRGPDLLFADSLHVAGYVSVLRGPKILQEHNVESYLVDRHVRVHRSRIVRMAGAVEAANLARYERDTCNSFDAVIALSDEDRDRLRALGVRSRIEVIPPSVEAVEPVPDDGRRRIVHIGTGHWPPIAEGLRWYLREIHPLVRAALPGVETCLAGPPPSFLALGARDGGVTVAGYVDDLEPIYRSTAVFIVPLLVGGGVRLKIMHALARGLAVVSTSPGCDGLRLEHGRHLLVADEPRAFADAVTAVVRDAALRRRLGEEGRAAVLDRYGVERRCAALAALVREVAGRRITER